jgi:hypothetical protein
MRHNYPSSKIIHCICLLTLAIFVVSLQASCGAPAEVRLILYYPDKKIEITPDKPYFAELVSACEDAFTSPFDDVSMEIITNKDINVVKSKGSVIEVLYAQPKEFNIEPKKFSIPHSAKIDRLLISFNDEWDADNIFYGYKRYQSPLYNKDGVEKVRDLLRQLGLIDS